MTSCQSSDFAMVSNDENSLTITCENAGDDTDYGLNAEDLATVLADVQ